MIDRVLPRNKRRYSRRSKSIGGGRFIPGGSIKSRGIRFFNAARPSTRNILIDKIESNSKRIKIKETPVTGKITGAGTPELTEKIPTGNIMPEDGKIGVKGGGPPKF